MWERQRPYSESEEGLGASRWERRNVIEEKDSESSSPIQLRLAKMWSEIDWRGREKEQAFRARAEMLQFRSRGRDQINSEISEARMGNLSTLHAPQCSPRPSEPYLFPPLAQCAVMVPSSSELTNSLRLSRGYSYV